MSRQAEQVSWHARHAGLRLPRQLEHLSESPGALHQLCKQAEQVSWACRGAPAPAGHASVAASLAADWTGTSHSHSSPFAEAASPFAAVADGFVDSQAPFASLGAEGAPC